MLPIEQNRKLAPSFPGLNPYGNKHSYMIIAATRNCYDVPLSKTDMYSKKSVKHFALSLSLSLSLSDGGS